MAAAVKVGLWCSHPSPARYLDGGEAREVTEPPPSPPECFSKVGFDDFVHSYLLPSFGRAAAVGGRWDAETQTSPRPRIH